MNEKEVVQLLESIKDDFYADLHFDQDAAWKRFAQEAGLDPNAKKRRYTFRDYVETYLWMFTHSLLKPMAAALAIFVFALGGSISVAGASGSALPGEKLYPVKLAMEQAQLALSFSDEQRAELRVEFASRRLDEMVAVAARLDQDTTADVQLAVNRFKSEVQSIQEELQGEDASQQKEFARAVNRKVEVYSSVADASTELSEDVRGEVEEILEETKEQVVEVIITAHESEQDAESAAELDRALAAEIASVASVHGEAATEAIATTEALREEGLYRRAFQVLKDFVFETEAQTSVDVEVELEAEAQIESEADLIE